jgi:hypothetical protein
MHPFHAIYRYNTKMWVLICISLFNPLILILPMFLDFKPACVVHGEPLQHGCLCNFGHLMRMPLAFRKRRVQHFPGRHKIIVSKMWDFTNVDKEDYLRLKEAKRSSRHGRGRTSCTLASAGDGDLSAEI